jgi:hypothetical protein
MNKKSDFPVYRLSSVWFLLLGLLLLPHAHALSQSNPPSVSITYVDASSFPQVTLHILARDANGVPMLNLTPDSFSIMEDQTSISFSLYKKTYGTQLVFIAEAGMGIRAPGATGQPRWTEMQTALEALFSSGWMLMEKDSVSLIVQEAGIPSPLSLATDTTDRASLLAAARQHQPKPEQNQYSDGLKAINDTVQFFSATPNDAGQFRAIVLLSQGLQSGGPEEVTKTIANLRTSNIPVYAILFRSEELDSYGKPLQSIAAQSGGSYLFYTGEDSLRRISDLLGACRDQYVVTYRSTSKESGNRIVMAGLHMPGASRPSTGKYSITISPPEVDIISPKEGELLQIPTSIPVASPAGSADAAAMPSSSTPPSGYRIETGIRWPDGHPRTVKRLQVWMNGQIVADETDPTSFTLMLPPESLPKRMGLVAQLQVRIMDELGLPAESKQINIVMSASASTGSFCSRLPGNLQNILCGGASAPSTSSSLLPFLGILLALVAIALVFVFRRPLSSAASHTAPTASHRAQEVGGTIRFRGTVAAPKAYLVDVERTSGAFRTVFELYGTTSIGRSRTHAEMVVQAAMETSPISRLHCTILEEDGEFYLRDDQSANGTFLNGTRLVPLERIRLKDGDHFDMAKLERGGVQFRFQRSKPEESGKPAMREPKMELTNRMPR